MALLEQSLIPRFWPAETDWTDVLADCIADDKFQGLMDFVEQERQTTTVFPRQEDVFNAFRFCSYEKTRVVILGQDPYHGDDQAHGLAFSVRTRVLLPPSLKNIFSELKADLDIDNCCNGNLTPWAKQGVLLLNTVLTVRRGKAHSHRNRGWEQFTDQVIAKLGSRSEPIVFVFWGKNAANKSRFVDSQHTIIESPHPSPLSAYRGFFGSRPFSLTNDALLKARRQPIDWRLQKQTENPAGMSMPSQF